MKKPVSEVFVADSCIRRGGYFSLFDRAEDKPDRKVNKKDRYGGERLQVKVGVFAENQKWRLAKA